VLSVDTNILLYAQNADCREHAAASTFLDECAGRGDIVICELVLLELYQLLRNPAVIANPLSAGEAASICQAFRSNSRWALVENAPVMSQVWSIAAQPKVARRRVFDARIALTLRHHGVRQFATHNPRDFDGFGFEKVFDPLVRR